MIRELLAGQISEAKNLFHFCEIDLLHGVGGLMIFGMKTGKPPDRRDIVQREWELIAALEDVQRGVPVPLVVEVQAYIFIGALNSLAVVGTVDGADQI